ncbi:MAG: hypothetical protein HC767_01740 [Akkermansiaceae bacterium]|nr:hypothetical protein [Akkermansiaceae bacterium]
MSFAFDENQRQAFPVEHSCGERWRGRGAPSMATCASEATSTPFVPHAIAVHSFMMALLPSRNTKPHATLRVTATSSSSSTLPVPTHPHLHHHHRLIARLIWTSNSRVRLLNHADL